MTDIVETDGAEFVDVEIHGLANRAISTALAEEFVDLGGSHYTLILTSTANAVETVNPTRRVTLAITSSADASDIDTEGPRELDLVSSGVATSTVVAIAKETQSFSSSAAASERVDTGALTAHYAEAANATATLHLSRPMALSESAAASDTVTTTRRSTISLSETAGASNALEAPAAMAGSATANATATVVATRLVEVDASATAAATETITAAGHKLMALQSTANATATVTTALHATTSIIDEANATERVRTSADTIGNFWCGMNGAAALWDGLPFNSMIERDGVVYAAGADGFYAMGAEQDDGIDVASGVTWDLMDYGSPQRKRWEGLYVLGAAPSPYTMRVVNHKGRFTYKTMKTREKALVQHRAEPGHGLESVEYRISLEHAKAHATNSVEPVFRTIARRV